MATDVTVTGGTNNSATDIGFNVQDRAYLSAQALANAIAQSPLGSQPSIVYTGADSPGYTGLVTSPASEEGHAENLAGFQAIVVQNPTGTDTVYGGVASGGQTVLAGVGGLTFYANIKNVEQNSSIDVAALGGNNYISFAGSSGLDVATTSTGNDTIIAGEGTTSVSAGAGNNLIQGGSGPLNVLTDGADTVKLASGPATVAVDPSALFASDYIVGPSVSSAAGYALTFTGGFSASTVIGGAGSYDINASTGGGVFTGGSAGDNYITGAGALTITGGGNGDYLSGSGTNDLITAAGGNETLVGGAGGVATLVAGPGNDVIDANGADTVKLGTGVAQVFAGVGNITPSAGGSAGSPTVPGVLVEGSLVAPTVSGYSLIFNSTSPTASTVLGGLGSYFIDAGSGGGVFTGGLGGNNYITGTGPMDIVGGGKGDTLQGGNIGNNLITAGAGAETLSAGAGNTTMIGTSNPATSDDFSFANIGAGSAQPYVIEDFQAGDVLQFANATAAAYAAANYAVSNGSGTITLPNGAEIILLGYAGAIGDFTSGADTISGLASGQTSTVTGGGTVTTTGGGTSTTTGGGTTTTTGGGSSTLPGGYTTYYCGGDNASTIHGGQGSYYINGSVGGGVFMGGSGGHNDIFGTGAMTITGGGAGDSLHGGDIGKNVIGAGTGVETLSAGQGNATLIGNASANDVFSFADIGKGVTHSYVIDSFHVGDMLHFANQQASAYAVANYAVSNGSGTITMQDSTKIVLQGYTGGIGNGIV